MQSKLQLISLTSTSRQALKRSLNKHPDKTQYLLKVMKIRPFQRVFAKKLNKKNIIDNLFSRFKYQEYNIQLSI